MSRPVRCPGDAFGKPGEYSVPNTSEQTGRWGRLLRGGSTSIMIVVCLLGDYYPRNSNKTDQKVVYEPGMNVELIIATMATVIVASYLYNMFSRWSKIPSVILLLGTGIAVRQFFHELPITAAQLQTFVQLFGVAGLVMIVLEASLDLKIARDKLPLIGSALLSAIVIFLASLAAVAALLHYWYQGPWRVSIISAIPLSIISSAIVIPSTEHLPTKKKQFVIYESSFSDIVGILLFNFIVMNENLTVGSFFSAGGYLLISLVGSVLASMLLLWLTERTTTPVKFFLLLSVLFLLYTGGKLAHLPSLVVVLAFGLILNNLDLILHPKSSKYFNHTKLVPIVDQFKSFTTEISFFLRTFFFVLFGFSMDLQSLASTDVLLIGVSVVLILLGIRFLYLQYFLKTNLFPEIFLMPRGLITVLLFYSIPASAILPRFEAGILFFVIVATTVLMAIGLLSFKVSPEDLFE